MGFNAGGSSGSSKGSSNTNEITRGSGTESQWKSSSQNPWGGQAPYLADMFQRAHQALGNYGMNDQELGTANQGYGNSQWRGDQIAGMEGTMMQDWKNLQDQQRQATDRYNGVVDQVLGTTMGDIQNQAADFAGNNPYLDQSVESSWNQANKMLGRNVGGVGGINHSAGASGNMSSSRAGVAEGLARSEMADLGQENELALRQQAYTQGLGQANQMLGNKMNMAGMLQTGPADMAALLQGQQASSAGFQDMQNNNLQNQMGWASRMDGGSWHNDNQWNNMQNAWNIIGGRSWGGESFDQGGGAYDRWGNSTSHTDSQERRNGFSLNLFGGK